MSAVRHARRTADRHRDPVDEQHGRDDEVAEAQPVAELDVAAHRRAAHAEERRATTTAGQDGADQASADDARHCDSDGRRSPSRTRSPTTATRGQRREDGDASATCRHVHHATTTPARPAASMPGPDRRLRQRAAHERRRHELARAHVPLARALDDRQQRRRRLVRDEARRPRTRPSRRCPGASRPAGPSD